MLIPVQNAYISLYFIKIWPFKPCTLPKHVIGISLYTNFPVKTLYFPVRDCSVVPNLYLVFYYIQVSSFDDTPLLLYMLPNNFVHF